MAKEINDTIKQMRDKRTEFYENLEKILKLSVPLIIFLYAYSIVSSVVVEKYFPPNTVQFYLSLYFKLFLFQIFCMAGVYYYSKKYPYWKHIAGAIYLLAIYITAYATMFFHVRNNIDSNYTYTLIGGGVVSVIVFFMYFKKIYVMTKEYKKFQEKQKERYEEIKFEAEMDKHKRNDNFRINYVRKNMAQIIANGENIRVEHKEFFLKKKEFVEFCKAQDGGEEIVNFKKEPFILLKMAEEAENRMEELTEFQKKMENAIENIFVEDGSNFVKIALRNELESKLESSQNFSQALQELEAIWKQIIDNHRKRMVSDK